jgi:hypothetical protein
MYLFLRHDVPFNKYLDILLIVRYQIIYIFIVIHEYQILKQKKKSSISNLFHYSTGENIALNATTSQSSTAADWTSDRAVDGCTNRSAEAPCSSKTQPSTENFLQINLARRSTVGRIVVTGPEEEGFRTFKDVTFFKTAFSFS